MWLEGFDNKNLISNKRSSLRPINGNRHSIAKATSALQRKKNHVRCQSYWSANSPKAARHARRL